MKANKKFHPVPKTWAKVLSSVGLYTPCFLGGKTWKLDHVSTGKKDKQVVNHYWCSTDGKDVIQITTRKEI